MSLSDAFEAYAMGRPSGVASAWARLDHGYRQAVRLRLVADAPDALDGDPAAESTATTWAFVEASYGG